MSPKHPANAILSAWKKQFDQQEAEYKQQEAEYKDRRRRLDELDAAFQALDNMPESKTNADVARVYARAWGHLARLLDANPDLVVVPLEKITAEPGSPKEYALCFVQLAKANEKEAAEMFLEFLERWEEAPRMNAKVLYWLHLGGLRHEIRGGIRVPSGQPAMAAWVKEKLRHEIWDEIPAPSATEAKAEPGVSAAPATGEPETKGKRINERILATVQQNPDSVGWTIREWATHLGCSISTIQATRAWEMVKKSRALDAADSGVNRERERRRSRRRSVED
jgi:hypothetical protein